MKDKFPYLGKDVLITQDMCDLNEHMNVIYYAKIFEDEFPFYDSLGFTSDYFKQGYSFFTLEMNIRYLKEMPWKPTKDYDIGTDIVYSGHPSWHKLMSFKGRIVGYEQIEGSGTQLIVNTYGWFGCSGSGVYNTSGELVGILYGVDVQYAYGTQIQENLIWVAPIRNLDIKSSLDAFCRGSIENYKACK